MTSRNPQLEQWLQQISPLRDYTLQAMQGDASFRRYFRLHNNEQSYVVMDASKQMDCCEPYVAIANALLPLGLAVPEILSYDSIQGFLLISDFGDRLYLNELRAENADALYQSALDSLVLLQACPDIKGWPLPSFNQDFLQHELDECHLWFLERYLKLSFSTADQRLLQDTFTQLMNAASQQTQVFMHRDYHSANLMVLPGNNGVGILDFQDACRGPVTYDLVSLLRDCYISWPDEKVKTWVSYYYEKLRARDQLGDVSLNEFQRWFDWMGMQRHLKALFIFARKYLRDHTPRYLQHIPRTLNYVVTVSARYPELRAFHAFASEIMLPALHEAQKEVA